MVLHVAICDDDVQMIQFLEETLQQYTGTAIEVDTFTDGQVLLERVAEKQGEYQLFLLDIEMTSINGVDLARKIRLYDNQAVLVFITSFVEYMQEVFQVQTFDYLLKPVTAEKVFHVLERAEKYLYGQKSYFHFTYQREPFVEETGNICYFEKKGRTAMIYTTNHVYQCNLTVAEILSQLNPHVFVQTHAAFVVNLQYVRGIKGSDVLLTPEAVQASGAGSVPVSRKFKEVFKEKLLHFVKERMS